MAAVGGRTDGERLPSRRRGRPSSSPWSRLQPPARVDAERFLSGGRTRKNYIRSGLFTNYNATVHRCRFGQSPSARCRRRRYCRGITPHLLFIPVSSGVRSPCDRLAPIRLSRGRLLAHSSSRRRANALSRRRTDTSHRAHDRGYQPMTAPSHYPSQPRPSAHTTPNGGVFE